MSERPIIFSGESVRAILADRKTMTRRIRFKCEVGDLLWVREDIFIHCSFAGQTQISYQVSPNSHRMFNFEIEYNRSFRPAMLMPKWAARIWLEITAIRVDGWDINPEVKVISFKKVDR